MGRTVVLFHSALGLRPAVLRWADHLRDAGHVVHTPDLFDGEVFDDLEAGVRKGDGLGMATLRGLAEAAVDGLPEGFVLGGFSLGVVPAELLAATRPGAKAALLMHGALAPELLGAPAWPGIPVEVHYAEGDPWVELDQVRALESAVRASGAEATTYVYDAGGGHLFADDAGPDHDRASADLMLERVLGFLDRL